MWSARLVLLFVLFGVLAAPVEAAPENGVSLTVEPFFGSSFKAGQWLPIRVTAANDGPDRQAMVRLESADGATFDSPLELPRGARKAFVMYVQPASFVRSLKARLLDGTQELAQTSAQINAWPARGTVIGVLTARPLAAPQPVIGGDQTLVTLAVLATNDIPPRPQGLGSFDILLLDGLPLDNLGLEQARALEDWVWNGGQLVVGSGENGRSLQTLPAPLRITAPTAPKAQVVDDTVLRELGAGTAIQSMTLTAAEGATTLDALTVQKELGRGRVTALGFSLSDPVLQRLPRATAFWPSILTLKRFDPNFPADATPDEMQGQQLTQALFNLPALALPPLTTLAVLLLVYILLVGPGLYLLLRWADRLAWAWVAIPVLTLLFGAAAYGYGLSIRGNDVILNQISIVRPMDQRAWVRSYAGIFSPSVRGYDIAVGGDALTRPLQFKPESMNGATTQPGLVGHYMQGTSAVRNLQVGQWTMNTFAAEGTVPFASISARLELGDGVLRGVVRNATASTLRYAALLQGGRATPIGDIAPGVQKPVELTLQDSGNPNGQPISMTIFKDRWDQMRGPPPELRLQVQVIDALYNYTPWSSNTQPIVVGWLDASPLPMRVAAARVQYQQLTLVEVPIELNYSRTVTFPRGWIRTEFDTTQQNQATCMTQWGPGAMLLNTDTVTATLRLPVPAQRLQVTKAALYTQIEGPPADRTLVEVYDWSATQWTKQAETLGTADLSDPARFVRNRAMRVRLKTGAAGPKGGGCVMIGATIGGTR